MCTQRRCEAPSSLLPSPEFEEDSADVRASEELESESVELCAGDKLDSAAEVSPREKTWRQDVKIPRGTVSRAVRELDRRGAGLERSCSTSANTKTSRLDENENVTEGRRDDSAPADGGERVVFSDSHSNKQASDVEPALARAKKSKESANARIKGERAAEAEVRWSGRSGRMYGDLSVYLGSLPGKLGEVCRDAGNRLSDTRSVLLSQYETFMSKELPLICRVHLQPEPEPEPEPCTAAENKVTLFDLTTDRVLGLSQNCGGTAMAGVAGLPTGSVFSLRDSGPERFCQRLVELPPALARLQLLSPHEIQETVESLAPHMQVGKVLQSIFWLETANRTEPVPKARCLVLTELDLVVVSADSEDTLAVSHHFSLSELKEVQIGLAGQHVRVMGCSEDTVLSVFTHSKDLTREFCRALLRILAPARFCEGTEGHALLSQDLMVLSLDWTSTVPDIVLDCGLRVTCRFKRVLADLLYIVHGNMAGSSIRCLADVRPLLYTSVKLNDSTQDIFQFLLTDTHVALVLEDGVFYPLPRGSRLVPVQPPFQALKLRRRSDIRCLLVRRSDDCLLIEIIFTKQKAQKKKAAPRRASADVLHVSDSWKLSFGCTSDAVTLINRVCV